MKSVRNNQPTYRLNYGDFVWELNGKYHREDGPAIECANGTRWWYLHGKNHREDGPAVEWYTGTREWYWRGKRLEVRSQEEFEKLKPRLLIQDIFS